MNPGNVRDLEKEGKLGNIAFSVGSSSSDAFALYKLDLRVSNLEIGVSDIASFMHRLAKQQKQQKKVISLLLQKQNKPKKRRKKI
jgi:hypothetical protein